MAERKRALIFPSICASLIQPLARWPTIGPSKPTPRVVASAEGFGCGQFSRADLGGFEKKPAGKAVRACIMEIVEYLECAMVDKGNCMSEYDAKEQRRKAKTKKSITLDESDSYFL